MIDLMKYNYILSLDAELLIYILVETGSVCSADQRELWRICRRWFARSRFGCQLRRPRLSSHQGTETCSSNSKYFSIFILQFFTSRTKSCDCCDKRIMSLFVRRYKKLIWELHAIMELWKWSQFFNAHHEKLIMYFYNRISRMYR